MKNHDWEYADYRDTLMATATRRSVNPTPLLTTVTATRLGERRQASGESAVGGHQSESDSIAWPSAWLHLILDGCLPHHAWPTGVLWWVPLEMRGQNGHKTDVARVTTFPTASRARLRRASRPARWAGPTAVSARSSGRNA